MHNNLSKISRLRTGNKVEIKTINISQQNQFKSNKAVAPDLRRRADARAQTGELLSLE